MSGGGVIPASSKKMIQSLKEITNRSEDEIYLMLKECGMDPNESAHRLLSSDPFHEVKSKREKKKEIKETSESRLRVISNTSNRGGRGGAERLTGRIVSSQYSGKLTQKKENGANPFPTPSTYATGVSGSAVNRRPASFSDSVKDESKSQSIDMSDFMSSSSSQPAPVYQSARVRAPGQVSLADIVKMGRPHPKVSISTHNVVNVKTFDSLEQPDFPALESQHHSGLLWDSPPNFSEPVHEVPKVEQSSASAVLEPSAALDVYTDSSHSSILDMDTAHHLNSPSDEVQGTDGDSSFADLKTESVSKQAHEDVSGASHLDVDSFSNTKTYQHPVHAYEDNEEISGSSQLSMPNYTISSSEDVSESIATASAKLQQLGLRTEDLGAPPARENPAVILPNHLQVSNVDLSHLSFGSFGGIGSYPGSFASNILKNDLEDAPVTVETSSIVHPDTRNSDYFGDEQLQSTSDDRDAEHRTGQGSESYDSPSSPLAEVIKQDTAEPIHEHQYNFSAPVPNYTLESSTQQSPVYGYAQTSSQLQSFAPLSSGMYTSSLLNNLPNEADQSSRESELQQYLLATQAASKYPSTGSSISGQTMPMPEGVKPGVFPSHGSSMSSAQPMLPPHLSHNLYSQSNFPLGYMYGYPYAPQSYPFPQAYAASSPYHQSPASVHSSGIKYPLPQYTTKSSASSLPQSTGYGGFGSSANIPSNFPLNPSSTHSKTSISYEDILASQFKDNNPYSSLQQNESWHQGPGTRTVSPLPTNYYGFQQAQNPQQLSGYRQGQQQPSQHYSAAAYPSFYQTQDQQQNTNDSQGQQTKQSHHMWQHNNY